MTPATCTSFDAPYAQLVLHGGTDTSFALCGKKTRRWGCSIPHTGGPGLLALLALRVDRPGLSEPAVRAAGEETARAEGRGPVPLCGP